MNVLPAYISLYHVYARYLWSPEGSIGSSGKGVTDVMNHCMGAGN